MAPLRNPRHECFIRHLLEGKTAVDAFELAGFKRDDGNAARLRRNPKVEERLAELQAELAGQTKITVESLVAELEDARKRATDVKQLSAAIRAVEAKAKLSGLMVERQKIEIDGGNFDRAETAEEMAAEMADDVMMSLDYTHSATPEDRERLVQIYIDGLEMARRVTDEAVDALVQEVRNRPLGSVVYQPHALPSPLNGKETEH